MEHEQPDLLLHNPKVKKHSLNNLDNHHGKTAYRFRHFGQSISHWTSQGVLPAKFLFQCAEKTGGFEPLCIPFALLGLTSGIVGGLTGGLAGSVHGFFRAINRHPFDLERKEKLFKNLEEIANISITIKQTLINQIILNYSQKRTLSNSNSSSLLFNSLQDPTLGVEEKWNMIEDYLLENENNYFKNNGKKLFCIIDNILTEYKKNPLIIQPNM